MEKSMLEEEIERINNLNLPEERKENIILVKTTALKLAEKLEDIEHINYLAELRLIIDSEIMILEGLLSIKKESNIKIKFELDDSDKNCTS